MDAFEGPYRKLHTWMAREESDHGVELAHSAVLSTVDRYGMPSSRIVRIKNIDQHGFVFFTNRQSHKGHNLAINPNACLNFIWHQGNRQVVVKGKVDILTELEMDGYFASIPRKDQIGAWADHKKSMYRGFASFEARFHHFEDHFSGSMILRPDWWQGYCLVPTEIDFLEGEEFKLHDRDVYEKRDNFVWDCHKVLP